MPCYLSFADLVASESIMLGKSGDCIVDIVVKSRCPVTNATTEFVSIAFPSHIPPKSIRQSVRPTSNNQICGSNLSFETSEVLA